MPDSPQASGAARPAEPVSEAPEAIAPAPEPKLPSRKDASLKEFLAKMDDYAPIIPDAVTNYYLTRAGLPPPPTTDPRLSRLLALATQKFVADIAADAYQYSRIRSSNSSSANNPMGNLVGAAGGASAAPVGAAEGKAQRAGGGALGVQRPGYGGGGQGGGQGRTVLTMEDLGMAVGEYGVNVKRGSTLPKLSPILPFQTGQTAAYKHPDPKHIRQDVSNHSHFQRPLGNEKGSSRRCSARLQGAAEGHNRHKATPRRRKDRDYALRRPPRPIYRNQTDLNVGNPIFPRELQRGNAMRQPADRRPQGLQRSNTVQFQGEAPRLPNVRATAIFRESQNLDPDTLRQYLGSAGVPFESPEISAYQRPPAFPSASHNQRTRARSNNRQTRPNTQYPYDNDSSQYMDRLLPPAPLRPRRATSSTYRPPPVSSRYSSQRPSPSSSQQQQVALTGPMPESPSLAPSYHLGMPTDRELNRMSREIESVESAWVNASRRPSQQQPVVRQSTGSLAAPRRHRSQREGDALVIVSDSKLALSSNQAIMHNF
ncbi:hypothetical protein V493_03778 [Pseudogymnoascus sp. VKM F-4281 (FW-2241)]|nr:hypothetical protein V493_03778 [Pseudogymnoascus sp. VKM F-4281 (FW-2241)]